MNFGKETSRFEVFMEHFPRSVRGTQRPICYTPVNENKCYQGIFRSFSVLLGKHNLFLFPSKTHKKFPSQLDKIGWFPSQLIKFISQPGIPRAFKSLDPKRPNKSDKTGTKQVFFRKRNHSDQPSYVCDYCLGEGRVSFFFFFFFLVILSLQSFYSQLGLKC